MKYIITIFLLALSFNISAVCSNPVDQILMNDCREHKPNTDYQHDLRDTLRSMIDGLNIFDNGVILTNGGNEGYYLNLIRLRFRAFAAYQIPVLAKIKVIPHLELFFTRKPPKNWTPFRPKP